MLVETAVMHGMGRVLSRDYSVKRAAELRRRYGTPVAGLSGQALEDWVDRLAARYPGRVVNERPA